MPSSVNVNVGFCSVDVPSPAKSQLQVTISSGYEVDVSVNCTDEPSSCGSGFHVKAAVGMRSLTVIS